MKNFLWVFALLCFELNADYVKKTIAVCADAESIEALHAFTKEHAIEKGGLELEMWLMQNDCKVIDKKTAIKVMNYTGETQRILKVLLKKSGEIVYTPNRGIQIEQPGQKNVIYKF